MPKRKSNNMRKKASRLLFLLSPAKTLDFSLSKRPALPFSNPPLLTSVDPLLKVLKKKGKPQLKSILHVSDNIATLNYNRYKAFDESKLSKKAKPVSEKYKQCILSYNGAAYGGLNANSLSDDDLVFCNDHLRIISGLYGVLRPLDLIQPYRLDFGLKVETELGKNLYEYWGDRCGKLVDDAVGCDGVIINVASNEYFKGVSKHLKSRVITCEFKDGGRVISVFAKRARGLMVKFAVQQRIQTVEDVKKFDLEGYSYSEKDSSDDVFVFSRAKKPSKSNVIKRKDASKPEKKRRKIRK